MANHSDYCVISLLTLALVSGIQASIRDFYKATSLTLPLENVSSVISSLEARSRILCSARCGSDDACSLFSYEVEDKNCTMRSCQLSQDASGLTDVLNIPTDVTANLFVERGACKNYKMALHPSEIPNVGIR